MATRQPNNPTQTPTTRPAVPVTIARNSASTAITAKPDMASGAGTAKRKAEDGDAGPPPKAIKTEVTGASQRFQPSPRPTTAANPKPTAPKPTTSVPYRGTARGDVPATTAKPAAKPVAKAGTNVPAKPAPAAGAGSAPAPKKGFAAILARAQQSHQANAAAAVNTIKHTPREKPPKISRSRMQQQAMEKQQAAGKNGKVATQAGSVKNGGLTAGKPGPQAKKGPPEVGYKGTMRKLPAPINYKGTMRAVDVKKPSRAASPTDRFGGKAKNGGYADWSDLSDAEDDPQEDDYESESDMEGGFDEMENEEAMAARIARKEDQEALAEEERHRKEKLERKKKLEALSKQASGRKKF